MRRLRNAMPRIDDNGDLIVPFACPERFHYWKRPEDIGDPKEYKGPISLEELLRMLDASPSVLARYGFGHERPPQRPTRVDAPVLQMTVYEEPDAPKKRRLKRTPAESSLSLLEAD